MDSLATASLRPLSNLFELSELEVELFSVVFVFPESFKTVKLTSLEVVKLYPSTIKVAIFVKFPAFIASAIITNVAV